MVSSKTIVDLPKTEKELLQTWVDNGSPEGDPADLARTTEVRRRLADSEPDEVHYMTEEPVDVPADGVVEYKYYTVDPGWTEDKWIKASEARPDNRARRSSHYRVRSAAKF